MANIDIMFGVRPKYTIEHVITGKKAIKDILIEVSPGVTLIPGGSGVHGLNQLGSLEKQRMMDQVSYLGEKFDYMLIDTPPGIDENVLYLNSAVQDIVVLVTPDPSSILDSYALIKVLNAYRGENRFSIICNMVRDETEALNIFRKLSDLAQKSLCVGLEFKGFVPMDSELRKATKSQHLIAKIQPRCPSSFAIGGIANNISNIEYIGPAKGGMQFFWGQMVGVA